METIGVFDGVPLVIDPWVATAFALFGWLVVLAIVFYTLYKWSKSPQKAAK